MSDGQVMSKGKCGSKQELFGREGRSKMGIFQAALLKLMTVNWAQVLVVT